MFTRQETPQPSVWTHEHFETQMFNIEYLLQQGDIASAGQQAEALVNQALQAGETAYQEAAYDIATAAFMLGNVCFFQQNYPAALSAYQHAKNLFSRLNEAHSIAVAWHQIGVVYTRMQYYTQAEQACRESLSLKNGQGNQADIASTLNQLGNIYDNWSKFEQAVDCYRQAATSYAQLDDKLYEGVTRSNIANSLIALQRYEEARSEVQRAMMCKQDAGHVAEPWKTWNIAAELEQAIDNPRSRTRR